SIVSMLIVGRLIGRVDTRILLIIGQALFAASFYHMSTFTLDTPASEFVGNGVFQGLGTGFVFLPLTTMAFATLAPSTRGDATSFYTLMRNLGGSAGISIMLAMLVNFSAGARGQLVDPYSAENTMVQSGGVPQSMSITDPTGIVVLSGQIDHQ